MKPSALLALTFLAIPAALPQTTVVTSGLQSPYKLTMTPGGNLLVSEAGTQPHTGRITLVNRGSGAKTVLLAGLPSVGSDEGAEGITAMVARDRTIYALVGEGDVLVTGTAPGTQVPNPKAGSSPIFSSLLALNFSVDLESINREFTLSLADQAKLADGLDLELDNGAGAKVTVQLLTNFPDFLPDPNTVARASHPFGMDFLPSEPNYLYIADSGLNKLIRVDVTTGRARTITTFPPVRNNSGFGPPVTDTVPTSVRAFGPQSVLVTYLTGFPFPKGAAGAYLVDVKTGAWQPFIQGHTAAMDVAVRDRDGARPQFWLIEFSTDMLAQPGLPGRLLQYDTEAPRAIQNGLITPVSMVVDQRTGEIFISELATGRIVKAVAQ